MAEIKRSTLFGKLNPLGYKSIEAATIFCKMRGNPYVEAVHWLHQLLQQQDSDVLRIFKHFGLDASRLAADLVAALDRLPRGATAILITPSHDLRWVIETQALKRRGLRMVAVVIDPATFGPAGARLPSNAHLAETLWATQIPAYRVNEGDNLAVALTRGGQPAWRYSG